MKRPLAQLPYKLTLRRIYILPTRFGALFTILLFSMLLGSVNYNNNLGFLLAFLLSSMGIVSIIHTYRNLSGIQIVTVHSKPVFAGENAEFEIIIRAERQGRVAIKLGFDNEKNSNPTDLFKEKDNCIKVNVKTDKRGFLKPGILNISTCYPFGLFRAWSRLLPDVECLVYPKPAQGSFKYVYTSDTSEDGALGATGSGVDDFKGLLSYQPGDSLSHISWKSFSKGQGILVKKFEGRTGAAIIIDWMEIKESDPEKKISLMCGMVIHANILKATYSLKIKENIVPPGNSDFHKHQCLKVLALFDPAGKSYENNQR